MRTILLVVAALLCGALARGALVPSARASGDALTRSDVDRIVRALEAQARATERVSEQLRESARTCR